MGSHSPSHYVDQGLSVAKTAAVDAVIGQAALGTVGNVAGMAMGAVQGVKDLKAPAAPDMPAMPSSPAQAYDPVTSVGGFNMNLAQQNAKTAGGTIFSTPSDWWGKQQKIGSAYQGKTLIGT